MLTAAIALLAMIAASFALVVYAAITAPVLNEEEEELGV